VSQLELNGQRPVRQGSLKVFGGFGVEQENRKRSGDLSRRDFLKGLTSSTAGGVVISAGGYTAWPEAGVGTKDALSKVEGVHAILIDTTRCTFCGKCVDACEKKHQRANPGTFYTSVTLVHGKEKDRRALAVPMHCMHCIDPPCVEVCQGKALEKTPLGPVLLDEKRCIGCLSCINACPFKKSLHYDPSQRRVFKCDMCYDLISEGAKPACVKTCEERRFNVFSFGTFDEVKQLGVKKAKEIDGVLLYPEASNTLVLFAKEEFNEPIMEGLFGLTETYSQQAQVKADITQIAHFGWLPIIGGLGLYIVSWRKNRMEELVKTKKGGK
jgi:Fe-S-cluster-containing dehydrogenase component